MNKFFFIFIFLALQSQYVLGQHNIADKKVIAGSKDLPLEMNLLISSLQSQAPEKYGKVLEKIFALDRYARSLNKEDLFLIGKVEIYRTLLKNTELPKQPTDGDSLKILRASLEKTNDPFAKWFLKSLIQDTVALLDLPLFKEFLLSQNATGLDFNKYRRVIKKSQIIQSWVLKLNPQLDDFEQTLRALMIPKMEEALNNIENSFFILASHARLEPLNAAITDEKDLKFFSIKTEGIKTAPVKVVTPKEEKTVDDILGPLTGGGPVVLPVPSEENWVEEENVPPALKNLPKPSDDADWLQDI
jgi:hypothetical protein